MDFVSSRGYAETRLRDRNLSRRVEASGGHSTRTRRVVARADIATELRDRGADTSSVLEYVLSTEDALWGERLWI